MSSSQRLPLSNAVTLSVKFACFISTEVSSLRWEMILASVHPISGLLVAHRRHHQAGLAVVALAHRLGRSYAIQQLTVA
jgi:hypothetical protein